MKIFEEIVKKLIERKVETYQELDIIKREFSKKHRIPFPKNIDLLTAYKKLLSQKRITKSNKLEKLLKTRSIRSLSGVVNISVLAKDYPCAKSCIYCPKENGIPKSYVSGEPAVERAKRLNFDPFLQVKERIKDLEKEGHNTEKIELRIICATWSFYSKKYQTVFIKKCFLACNFLDSKKKKIFKKSLEKTQRENEKAKHKIVSLSIETRPDCITKDEIKRLRKLGVTKVELGVQSIFDDVLNFVKRGHSVKETIFATKLLKDAGFKVSYQLMPNLPLSSFERDLKMFKEIFENEDFKPDYLKIYPLMILEKAPIYRLWKKGEFSLYSEEKLIDLILAVKKIVPFWIRIERIVRDIPTNLILAGVKTLNLRQIIFEKMKSKGLKCNCLRCREVREKYDPKEKIYLFREDYLASGGKEIFLSFEDKEREKLLSFLRLRIPASYFEGKKHFLKVLEGCAIIREVKTLGELTPLGEKNLSPQHRGLGKKLIKIAEEISKNEFGLKKIAAISAVGARDYFRKLGFKLEKTYMVKGIKN